MAVLLFVHGVATRAGKEYDIAVAARDRRFAERAFAGHKLTIKNTYWGKFGAAPQWNLACIPPMSGRTVDLGTDEEEAPEDGSALLRAARADFPAVVAALSVEELTQLETDGNAKTLVAAECFWAAAADYARRSPDPAWLQTVQDDAEFVAELGRQVAPLVKEADLGILDPIADAAKRLGGAISNWVNAPIARIGREKVSPAVAVFIGDVFRYLHDAQPRHDIRKAVTDDLVASAKTAHDADEPLVVMGHSMGGVILYDLLSDPDVMEDVEARLGHRLLIDLFMTIGSQVALFEELKAFSASDPARSAQAKPPLDRAVRPAPAARWWNAYDRMDVLSFIAEPVFADVKDFEVDTIAGVRSAHGAYFTNMVFYQRLGKRMHDDRVMN